MTDSLKRPAVRRALAWVACTGYMPSHLRTSTWVAVYEQLDSNGSRYTLKPAAAAALADHPMIKAHQVLVSMGFDAHDYGPRHKRAGYVAYRNRNTGADGSNYGNGRWETRWSSMWQFGICEDDARREHHRHGFTRIRCSGDCRRRTNR